jgi:DegV family protein with EDD domain
MHIHVDHPGVAFSVCRQHGEVSQQKADDMFIQTTSGRSIQQVAIVTDSGADLPDQLASDLMISKVPLRFNFGDVEYLDRLDMTVHEFYRRMAVTHEHAQTSQPPSGDYRRLYGTLADHAEGILNITVSGALSGTIQAARQAQRPGENIHVFDSLNASGGQGLLAIAAARMAAEGAKVTHILQTLERLRADTFTIAVAKTLTHAARGGRIPQWLATLSGWLGLQPVLKTSIDGKLKPAGVVSSRRDPAQALANWIRRRLPADYACRMLISHGDDLAAAERLQRLLQQHFSALKECWIAETGPAIGAHAGPGVLVLAVQPLQPRA